VQKSGLKQKNLLVRISFSSLRQFREVYFAKTPHGGRQEQRVEPSKLNAAFEAHSKLHRKKSELACFASGHGTRLAARQQMAQQSKSIHRSDGRHATDRSEISRAES
jgi:hypothetical protein